ncbi:UNVERIFIED_CONTAM: Asparagine--tRNA ligase, cytoplasmic 1 [Sesamum calycinum]|uniref:Asparagine--tRNA ligase, cytoplasmic 1 n=1 Tax=Sesamum calycinum TaxID=2727403 RepID=A0AAW2N579_9LAMI
MVAKSKLHRVTYTDAVAILEEAAKVAKFKNKVEWEIDLASELERYLIEEKFPVPVIVYNYPKATKAFYMKLLVYTIFADDNDSCRYSCYGQLHALSSHSNSSMGKNVVVCAFKKFGYSSPVQDSGGWRNKSQNPLTVFKVPKPFFRYLSLGHLLIRFAGKGLTYRRLLISAPVLPLDDCCWIERLTVPAKIGFSMTMLQIASEPIEISYVFIIYEAEDFCNLVMNESLMDHVQSFQHGYPHHSVCYARNRLMA